MSFSSARFARLLVVAAVASMTGLVRSEDPPATKYVRDYAGQAEAPPDTRRIMFLAESGHGGHEFVAGALYFARTINAVYPNAWAVVYPDKKWPQTCADQHAIIVIMNHGGRVASDRRIPDAIQRRAGFMAVHYGLEVEKGEQGNNYLNWLGGYFEPFWSVNPWWKPELAVNTSHPTTRGVKPFVLTDEWYYHMRFRDGLQGVTPILSAIPPSSTLKPKDDPPSKRGGNPDVWKAVENKEPQHLAWAYERPDGGRGYGFTGFHVFNNLTNDSYRTALLNGVAWVAGLDIPENGVPSTSLSLDDLQAMRIEVHGPPKK